ncbi:MAG: thiamine diphosphokinase [Actinomycetota bacterium]|nr:thiamine diphosphokinase [Actinomycetota bacterium]
MNGDRSPGTTGSHALILTGGPLPLKLDPLPKGDMVIAADKGIDNARQLGIPVDLLVGDLDSASDNAEAFARSVQRHPVDKDQTDLELALAATLEAGMQSVTVVGTMAGRVDHALGNLLLLAADRWQALRIDARIDSARAWVVRDRAAIDGAPDDLVSLMAVGGPAAGVSTSGLAWPLDNALLESGPGLGLSNRMTAPIAELSVRQGVILVIAPGRSID